MLPCHLDYSKRSFVSPLPPPPPYIVNGNKSDVLFLNEVRHVNTYSASVRTISLHGIT